jgi:hypothetical protein
MAQRRQHGTSRRHKAASQTSDVVQ